MQNIHRHKMFTEMSGKETQNDHKQHRLLLSRRGNGPFTCPGVPLSYNYPQAFSVTFNSMDKYHRHNITWQWQAATLHLLHPPSSVHLFAGGGEWARLDKPCCQCLELLTAALHPSVQHSCCHQEASADILLRWPLASWCAKRKQEKGEKPTTLNKKPAPSSRPSKNTSAKAKGAGWRRHTATPTSLQRVK